MQRNLSKYKKRVIKQSLNSRKNKMLYKGKRNHAAVLGSKVFNIHAVIIIEIINTI